MSHQAKQLPIKDIIKLSSTSLTRNVDSLAYSPTIFLHGFLGSRKTFTPLARYLQNQKKIPCYLPDLRNHGETKPWVYNMDYISQANDLRQFINDHGFRKVNLVGFSMGTKIIMDYIFRELHNQDSIEIGKMILMDNGPITKDIGMKFREYAKVLREVNEYVTFKKLNQKTWKQNITARLKQNNLPQNLILYFLDLFEKQGHQIKIKITPHILEESILKELGEFPEFNNVSTDIDTLFIKASQSEFMDGMALKAIENTFTNYKILEFDADHQDLLAHYGIEITSELAKFLET